MNENEADIKISQNWGQDFEGAKAHAAKLVGILEPLKEKGLLDFDFSVKRKCDFCGKILEEGDNFETIGDLDKCDKCKEEGK